MDVDIKVGEVIASNSSEFMSQCYKLNQVPAFGALVKTKGQADVTVYAFVYHIETHGIDEGRRVFIRGEKLENEKQIFSNNPQLERLLVTDFKALVAGFKNNKTLYYYLPPQPSFIHSFVYVCPDKEVLEFFNSFNFLNTLAQDNLSVSGDEIVAACLRYASNIHPNPREFLIKAGRELVWILGGDIRRLNTILKRLDIGR